MHLRKALQGLAASGHPLRVSLSATPQAGSPSAAANAPPLGVKKKKKKKKKVLTDESN
jgi:hypothetical protein